MSNIIYKKVGNRYRAIGINDDAWEYWPEGFHIVYSLPKGGRLSRFHINPDKAGLICAALEKEDKLATILREALSVRPKERPITPIQKEAWDTFVKVMGNDRFILQYDSMQSVIDKMIATIIGDGESNETR